MDTIEARLLYLEEELERVKNRLQYFEGRLEEGYENHDIFGPLDSDLLFPQDERLARE